MNSKTAPYEPVRREVEDNPADLIEFVVLKKDNGEYKKYATFDFEAFLEFVAPPIKVKDREGNEDQVKYNIVNEATLWAKAPPMIGSRYEGEISAFSGLREMMETGQRTTSTKYMFICMRKGDDDWKKYFKETTKKSSIRYGSLIGSQNCSGNCSSCK